MLCICFRPYARVTRPRCCSSSSSDTWFPGFYSRSLHTLPVFVLSMFSASWPRGTFFLATWLLFGFFLFISVTGNVFQPNFSSLGANFCSRLFTWERRKKRCGGGLCRMNRGFFLKALLPSIHRTSQIMSSATEHDPVLCDDCSFRAHRVSARTVASQHLLHHIQNFLH